MILDLIWLVLCWLWTFTLLGGMALMTIAMAFQISDDKKHGKY